jgi:protein-S-isoprenylcysteine O-methyltransferase
MDSTCRAQLKSCLYSFVPFVLSIPLLFVYSLRRLSTWPCLSLIGLLFAIHYFTFRRFYSAGVFVRAHALILLLTLGLVWSVSSPAIGLFTVTLATFHLSEFISVGLWCPRTLRLDSFLLNHSPQYNVAIVLAYAEYFLQRHFVFVNGMPCQSLWIAIGLTMVIGGEYLRKLAMCTAQQSFSHVIEDKPDGEHRLVTDGIYAYVRHPSYVGWFWWSCGTQVLLANPTCFLLYFFVSRLNIGQCTATTLVSCASRFRFYEEATLIRFYGGLYRDYQRRVRVGIPFIRGCP